MSLTVQAGAYREGYEAGVAAERKRCAKIAENRWRHWRETRVDDFLYGMDACDEIAAAIRAQK